MGTRSGIKYVKVFGGWKSSSLRGLVCKAFFFFFPQFLPFLSFSEFCFFGQACAEPGIGLRILVGPFQPGIFSDKAFRGEEERQNSSALPGGDSPKPNFPWPI